jgi:hypothetical protein
MYQPYTISSESWIVSGCDYVSRLRLDNEEGVSVAQVDRSWPTMTSSQERLAIDPLASAVPICGFPFPAWERGLPTGKTWSYSLRSKTHARLIRKGGGRISRSSESEQFPPLSTREPHRGHAPTGRPEDVIRYPQRSKPASLVLPQPLQARSTLSGVARLFGRYLSLCGP